MPDKTNNPFQFWEELKRRRVVRVIPVYAAAAFVILELADILSEPLRLPEWTVNFVLILLCIGFIISVILSWIYDVTPEGIEKTKPSKLAAGDKAKQSTPLGWKISTYISALIIIAFALVYFIGNIKQSSDISKLEKSIAVLPFENFSLEENDSHLGDAIANEIATQLVKIQRFQIRSFTSSLQYKGTNKPSMPQIGIELNANFIIEGTIELQNEDVSIHVQVIQANNDNHIWAHEFKDKWDNILTLRGQITTRIADELKTILSTSEIENIEKRPTENLEAYNYYLRGNDFYWRSYEEQDYSIAIKLYQKAIELDPDFALAYVMLAKSHLELYWFHYDRSMNRLIWSKEALDAAFEIDPDLADAYITLGKYYYSGFLAYDKALEQLETAMSLRSNDPECIYIMACVYRRKGEWQEARDRFMQAVKADPRSDQVAFNAAETHFLMGEYDQAIDLINLAINMNPDLSNSYIMKVEAYLKREGNTKNARKILDDAALIFNPSSYPGIIEKVVLLNIYEGKYQEAIDFLNITNFEAVQPQFYYHPKSLLFAWIYDQMGDKTKAVYYYEMSSIALEARISDYPDDSRLYSALGISYAGLGQKEQAIRAGKKGLQLLPVTKEAYRGVYRLGDLARIYVMVGEHGLAVEQLDYLLSIPGVLSAKLIQLDPAWKPLWNLPEFKQLIEKYSDN